MLIVFLRPLPFFLWSLYLEAVKSCSEPMPSTLPSVVVVVDDSDDDSENDPDPEVNSEDKTLIVLCEMVSLTSLQI